MAAAAGNEVFVVDASALLAVLFDEAGAEQVTSRLDRAVMSAVNFAEVGAVGARRGRDRALILAQARRLVGEIVEFSAPTAERTAALIAATRPLGLSLGDCACLATAEELGAVALTADRSWREVVAGPRVEAVR